MTQIRGGACVATSANTLSIVSKIYFSAGCKYVFNCVKLDFLIWDSVGTRSFLK